MKDLINILVNVERVVIKTSLIGALKLLLSLCDQLLPSVHLCVAVTSIQLGSPLSFQSCLIDCLDHLKGNVDVHKGHFICDQRVWSRNHLEILLAGNTLYLLKIQ